MATVRKIPKAEEEEKPPTIADIFGPRGLLERCLGPGYEHRRSQLEMAEIVEEAFQNKRHALVEAGTGTGKTLAYLLPAIRSGRRVVVSTATKSLQEQLFTKDVPFLQKHFAPELKVAVMKGRGNFLCRQKLYDMADQPVLKGLDEVDWFAQMRDWEKVTETGDRNELTFLPDDASMWNKLDARRDACTGQKCAEFKRCFVTAMHQRAAEADLIIVNHHLFFADLALRGDDFGSILPEYAAVIFDEAHEIEDVASDYFGREVSNYRFEELARDADLALRQVDPAESHSHLVAHLPASPGALPHQAHAAALQLPVVARNGRDMHQAVDGHFFQLHEQAKLQGAGNGRIEGFANARLQVQTLEIAHDVARRLVGAPLALRGLGTQRLQLGGAVLVTRNRIVQNRRL